MTVIDTITPSTVTPRPTSPSPSTSTATSTKASAPTVRPHRHGRPHRPGEPRRRADLAAPRRPDRRPARVHAEHEDAACP